MHQSTDFQSVFESLPDNFLVLTPDLVIVGVSDGYLHATMTTRAGIVGRRLFELFPDNPDDPAASGVSNLKASLERVLATRAADTMAVQKYDIRRPESEGGGFEERYWSPLNSPVLDAAGNVAYLVHRVQDVTDFIRLKQQDAAQTKVTEALRAQVEQAEMDVYLRAQELQLANAKLRELDRLKTEFFANVSHELRTPLTLILAPLESLLAADPPTAERAVLQIVHNNAVRLLQMINGLLDFSRISAEKMEVHREPVAIGDLTRSLFWDFESVMQQKGIAPAITTPGAAAVVEIDRYLYERVLSNLLSNAVKFTAAGGAVSLALDVGDGTATVSVTDTGPGISEGDFGRLFQKFQQLEGSSTRRFEGTGLGLALARECAELLGGTITVRSQVGQGSTFTFTCLAPPSTRQPAASPPHRQALEARVLAVTPPVTTRSTSVDGTLPRVVLAEDNAELAQFIIALLSPSCQVEWVSNGADALDLVRRTLPDLVLSDVMMPRIDGIRLTLEIKRDKATSAIPVVLLTALTNRESLLKGWAAGADDYLFKPFHPQEVEARVRSMLRSVQWRRASEQFRHQRDTLEQFTHIASHDLREPLRKIVSFVQLFRTRQPNLDAEADRYLQAIAEGATRTYRMLDALIDYTRLERSSEAREERELSGLVAEVLEELHADISACAAVVHVGPLPVVRVIPGPISSLFRNLVANALKYRHPERAPVIRVEAAAGDIEWTFSVSDNGIGIPREHLERVFIMFERLHTRTEYPGEGMGLAISRRIVEMHGGRIWVESEPGSGSTFRFTLLTSHG